METRTTSVLNNGNSQAVRMPAAFRLDTDRVRISRNESGDRVIHPLRDWEDLFEAADRVGAEGADFLTDRRHEPAQARGLFR